MKKTGLHAWHQKQGGKLVPFAGWEMPLHYGSQVEEHLAVRSSAGLFDVSHMTVVDVQGERATDFLRYLLANDVAKLKTPGKALYSCLLNVQGGILDDLIVYHLDAQNYRIVVNAGTTDKDIAWFNQHAPDFSVEISPRFDLSLVAIQGPQAKDIIQTVFSSDAEQITALKPFSSTVVGDYFIGRTGYTGEDGFEIALPSTEVEAFCQQAVDAGAKPCGLGARDTLRLEAGLNLYGTDMDESLTPYESNLGWTVALEPFDRGFIGRKALENQKELGVEKQLRAIVLTEGGVLRAGQKVKAGDAEGVITSGSYAPSLQCSIAFARIDKTDATQAEVEIRNKWKPVKFVKAPFIKKGEANF